MNEKKIKKYAEPEMGYCPFEHKAGALGAGGRWAQAALSARHDMGARRGTAQGRLGRTSAGSRRAGHGRLGDLGVLLGQQAVHSVHSACFDPVLTQYCS